MLDDCQNFIQGILSPESLLLIYYWSYVGQSQWIFTVKSVKIEVLERTRSEFIERLHREFLMRISMMTNRLSGNDCTTLFQDNTNKFHAFVAYLAI